MRAFLYAEIHKVGKIHHTMNLLKKYCLHSPFAQKIKDHEILEKKVFKKQGVLQLLRTNETLFFNSVFHLLFSSHIGNESLVKNYKFPSKQGATFVARNIFGNKIVIELYLGNLMMLETVYVGDKCEMLKSQQNVYLQKHQQQCRSSSQTDPRSCELANEN